jgi:hypothetical protein
MSENPQPRTVGTTGIAGDAVFAYDATRSGSGAIDTSKSATPSRDDHEADTAQAMATYSAEKSALNCAPSTQTSNDSTPRAELAAVWHS